MLAVQQIRNVVAAPAALEVFRFADVAAVTNYRESIWTRFGIRHLHRFEAVDNRVDSARQSTSPGSFVLTTLWIVRPTCRFSRGGSSARRPPSAASGG